LTKLLLALFVPVAAWLHLSCHNTQELNETPTHAGGPMPCRPVARLGTQIPNTAVIELLHERTWRLPTGRFAGLETDVLPALTAAVEKCVITYNWGQRSVWVMA
jgi:hypothetical protein